MHLELSPSAQGRQLRVTVRVTTVQFQEALAGQARQIAEELLRKSAPRLRRVRPHHGYERHIEWLYQARAKRLAVGEISLDEAPNPIGVGEGQIAREIALFDRLVPVLPLGNRVHRREQNRSGGSH